MAAEVDDPKVGARSVRQVRKALEDVRKDNEEGLLVAEQVVDAARDPRSSLHSYFEWDDGKAAEQHRLAQARALIRTIEVILPDDPDENLVPRYVSLVIDRKRPGGGYRETRKVLSNKQLLEELERTAKKELESWTQRYTMLVGLISAVRKAANLPAPSAKPTRSTKKPKRKK